MRPHRLIDHKRGAKPKGSDRTERLYKRLVTIWILMSLKLCSDCNNTSFIAPHKDPHKAHDNIICMDSHNVVAFVEIGHLLLLVCSKSNISLFLKYVAYGAVFTHVNTLLKRHLPQMPKLLDPKITMLLKRSIFRCVPQLPKIHIKPTTSPNWTSSSVSHYQVNDQFNVSWHLPSLVPPATGRLDPA